MAPVPPSATMFDGEVTVSWHFVGVGPVVTEDVVADSQPATMVAIVSENSQRYKWASPQTLGE